MKNTNKVEVISLLDFKTYIATVIKIMCYWQRNKHKDKWNSIENPDIDLHKYAKLIHDKGAKAIQWRQNSLFNILYWSNWAFMGKGKKNLNLNLISYTKVTQNGYKLSVKL